MATGSSADRQGLTICDATSAVFAMDLPWEKLDVVTWSWQKVLGGEAAHGMLALSPRAVARLESYTPPWPLPKIFRLTSKGKFSEGIFEDETINTPSMLAVEDAIDGLKWAEAVGGLHGAESRAPRQSRGDRRLGRAYALGRLPGAGPGDPLLHLGLPQDRRRLVPAPAARGAVRRGQEDRGAARGRRGVAYDIAGHRDAPPGLRIWCGATVERGDVEALLPWLDWAYRRSCADAAAA